MNRRYLEAAVKLALCPRQHIDCVVCHKCHFKYANGIPCYENLRKSVYASLEGPMGEDHPSLKADVSDLLLHLGVPANLNGYLFLRDAIIKCIHHPEYLQSFVHELYPRVAEEFNTTPMRVERSIRHAIECMWSKGNVDVLEDYFGNAVAADKGKVTNSQCISIIVDKYLNSME